MPARTIVEEIDAQLATRESIRTQQDGEAVSDQEAKASGDETRETVPVCLRIGRLQRAALNDSLLGVRGFKKIRAPNMGDSGSSIMGVFRNCPVYVVDTDEYLVEVAPLDLS